MPPRAGASPRARLPYSLPSLAFRHARPRRSAPPTPASHPNRPLAGPRGAPGPDGVGRVSQSQPPALWRTRYRWPARAGYLLILLLATLSPFTPDATAAHVAGRVARALNQGIGTRDLIDGARNIVLFAGWGVVWTLTSLSGVKRTVGRATLTGALISATVEIAQLFSANRNTSFLDLTTNTAGAFGGAAGLLALILVMSRRRELKSYVGVPALLFGGSYAAAALLEALIPLFRHDPLLGVYGPPWERFRQALEVFDWTTLVDVTVSDLLLFLPAGALVVAAMAESGTPYREAFRKTALAALLLAPLTELLHGFLAQPILAGAAIMHALTVIAGAGLAAAALPSLTTTLRGARRPRLLLLTYVAVLAAWAWRPFLPELRPSAIAAELASPWYIPLASLGGRMDFFSVADVCTPFFLYLPLGGLLAVWPLRLQGPFRGAVPAMLLPVVLEAGQLFVAGRSLDITDILIQASGAASGWAVMRLAGYRPYGEVWPERRS